MKTTNIALAVALIAALTLTPSTTAHAGGWALTYLDPMDERITLQAGATHTLTYWVLQHGNHPYQGELGATGLRFTDTSGAQAMFTGTALAEPAHYRVEVRIPRAGLWRVTAVQGIFADYELGLLNLPGRLAAYPVTPPGEVAHEGHTTHWGAVRPPGFCSDSHATAASIAPVAVATEPERQSMPWMAVAAFVLVTGFAVGLLLVRRRAVRPSLPS